MRCQWHASLDAPGLDFEWTLARTEGSGMWILETIQPDQTWELGVCLGEIADGPLVIALIGDLGCGKTCLAQGVAAGLGVEEEVLSPTYVLVTEYSAPLPLLHADVYRLDPLGVERIGLEEQLENWTGLALVEWADRFEQILPADHLRVCLEDLGESRRRIRLEAQGEHAKAALVAARQRWGKNDG